MPPRTPMKRADDAESPLLAAQKLLRRAASDLAKRLSGWAERLMPQNRQEADSAPPREGQRPPPPLAETPVLRFAQTYEPPKEEVEDVYEGETEGGGSFVQTAWLWTKRVVVTTGLVAAGIFAFVHREAWFPKARTAFTEVASYLLSRDQRERQQRALQGATEQLPHLAPETIQLVLSGNPALEPQEVFSLASDAVDRGRSALTSKEARELETLRQALLEGLSPGERERLREYDGVRARRATFSFENEKALALFARGARALPAASRERLQTLLGKAVAAGLAHSKAGDDSRSLRKERAG